jgi:ribonucleoside-diphosphate reductase alpha chain
MNNKLNESSEMVMVKPVEPFIKPAKAPMTSPAIRIRTITPFGHMHLTIVIDLTTERELEIFAQIGKAGEMVTSELEGLCRLSSLYLRAGGSLSDIIKQLVGIGSMVSLRDDFKGEREKTYSIPDSLGKSLAAYADFKKQHGAKAIVLGDAQNFDPIDVR